MMLEKNYIGAAESTRVINYQVGGDIQRFERPLCALQRSLSRKKRGDLLRCSDVLLTDVLEVEPSLIGMVHVVNVKASDVKDFYFESYGYRAGVLFGKDFDSRSISEISAPCFRQFVFDSYRMVKASKKSWFSDVSTDQCNFRSSYSRLMLPLCDDGGNISHVLVAIHRHSGHVI